MKDRLSLFRYAMFAALFWTATVLVSWYTNYQRIREQGMDMAFAEAQANLNKDITLRRWASRHGGVYVPITESQQPVPWMAHVPGRDVTTRDGQKLTLLNPATMLRQMMDDYADAYGIRGRITGLRQLNPGNAPDPWETKQLERFGRHELTEVWEVADIDGQPYLRYLRAMFMEPGCVKCHAVLGYKVGDMRGATGLNLPLAPYLQQMEKSTHKLTVSHTAIWLLGIAGIAWTVLLARRRQAEHELHEVERKRAAMRYQTLFEQSRDGILIIDPESRKFVEFNPVAHEQLGYTRDEFSRMGIGDIEADESPDDTVRRIDTIQRQGWDSFETHQRHKNGEIRDVQVIVQLLPIDGRPMLYCSFRDITERKTVEASLYLYANMFEHSGEAILVTDHENRIIAANPALTKLTGYAFDELLGQNPRILSSQHTPRETYQSLWASLREEGFWQGELWDRHKNGNVYPKWTSISAIRDSEGRTTHYIASFTDISERKAAEARIERLAHHDTLTGLFNRYNLESRLGQALLTARRESMPLAVIFIDMDRFKVINDTLGHQVGDHLLIQVAMRLKASVRESDIVARLGGDEFVVVLSGIESALDAMPVAGKILHALGQTYEVNGHTLHSTPSIGVSIFPSDGDDADTLMKNADTAMYHAKEQGRNNVQFFTDAMNAAAGERLELERDLRGAIKAGQLEIHYQPQVYAHSGEVRGVEALLRWRHPVHGFVPPLKFIPIAEESGQIEALGAWVLDGACRQIADWRAAGITGIHMAVNLSAHQLRSAHLVGDVRACMERHQLQAGDLELEVTESAAMANPERAISQLRALRDLGVRLAIDDFGTGYSSLAYLKLLPIQVLKLDRTFVRDIETDTNDAAISAATLALAQSLGLSVVAEGVETTAQQSFLSSHGCDFLQGYLFGKPEPAATWTAVWQGSRPTES
jgi:diguanylate cyclase (GGDEF)-like protein/PAS domain S-box-containing protein